MRRSSHFLIKQERRPSRASDFVSARQRTPLLGHLLARLLDGVELGQRIQDADYCGHMVMNCLSRGLGIVSTQGGDDLAMLADKITARAEPRPSQHRCARQ